MIIETEDSDPEGGGRNLLEDLRALDRALCFPLIKAGTKLQGRDLMTANNKWDGINQREHHSKNFQNMRQLPVCVVKFNFPPSVPS